MIGKKDRLTGVLLGTAIGDALGLPFEGLPFSIVQKKFKEKDRFCFLGKKGIVSDDTELSALLAQSLLKSRNDLHKLIKYFKASLFGWFLRLPWGIGLGTVKACLKIFVLVFIDKESFNVSCYSSHWTNPHFSQIIYCKEVIVFLCVVMQ